MYYKRTLEEIINELERRAEKSTAAEVEQKIKKHIEYLRSYAAECRTDAARAAELGKEYRDAIQAAEDKLTAATDHYKKQPNGHMHTSSLFWLITETR